MQHSTRRALEASLDSPSIPNRLYFKIGDVARICQVETYVLRFWETQFPQLRPNKSGTGQRLYRRRDVETALQIKTLVHGQGYTISGARQALEQGQRRTTREAAGAPSRVKAAQAGEPAAVISRARAELREIASMLAAPPAAPPRRRSRNTVAATYSDSLFPS